MIKRIKFLGIPVRDQERALRFYTENLGFRVFTDQPFNDKQRWIELTIPGAETGIVLFTPEAMKTGSGHPSTRHGRSTISTKLTMISSRKGWSLGVLRKKANGEASRS
ncbi:MAG TPA: VOC family protein [Bryobacteraceae bacterium]|nr:VOC family protein [Bryobacteraceae bacterium]